MNFKAKMACLNCGMEDFYVFPRLADISSYDSETKEKSSYELKDIEYDLDCKNCGLGYLIGSTYWDGSRPSDRRGTFSSAT